MENSESPEHKMPLLNRLRRFAAWCLYGCYLALGLLLLLELSYRLQVIDFYKTELCALNSDRDLAPGQKKKTMLIGGDSFTAQAQSYVAHLRDSLPAYRVINTAVSGSSAIEASYLLPARIKTFEPDIVVYQLYIGNDLMPYQHPLNWQKISWTRNVYWWLSERLHVLAYMNYKLGQWHWQAGNDADEAAQPSADEPFDVLKYRGRERLYARADPYLVSHSALLQGGKKDAMMSLCARLEAIGESLPDHCRAYLLVVPHKAQVSVAYRRQMEAVGYRFADGFNDAPGVYPFVDALQACVEEQRFRVVNALPPLRTHDAPGSPLYYHNDEHLNAAGHAWLAHTLLHTMHTDTMRLGRP